MSPTAARTRPRELILSLEAERCPRVEGFRSTTITELRELLAPARFRERESLETDPNYKQLIPYVVVVHERRAFAYSRSKRGSEERLARLLSIGVGGHIEWKDESLFDSDVVDGYLRAAQREVLEELHIGERTEERVVGFINDDSTDVGRVHLGILHVWQLAEAKVSPREQKLLDRGFLGGLELDGRRSELEVWSSIALDALRSDRTL